MCRRKEPSECRSILEKEIEFSLEQYAHTFSELEKLSYEDRKKVSFEIYEDIDFIYHSFIQPSHCPELNEPAYVKIDSDEYELINVNLIRGSDELNLMAHYYEVNWPYAYKIKALNALGKKVGKEIAWRGYPNMLASEYRKALYGFEQTVNNGVKKLLPVLKEMEFQYLRLKDAISDAGDCPEVIICPDPIKMSKIYDINAISHYMRKIPELEKSGYILLR
jgi:hypothetical protein